jgi:quercetin dioxygenase-like cupin family protein
MADPLTTSQQTKAQRIDEEWGSLSWLASRPLGNVQDLTLGRVTIRVGHSNPRHAHPSCEEVLYLLKGKIEHSLGDQCFTLEAGDTLAIPAGIFHDAQNIGDGDADMIVAYSSGTRDFVLENSDA